MSLLFLTLLGFSPVFAIETLETIEVSEGKDVSSLTFSQTEEISKEEIERTPVPLISQLLERVPGVVTSQNGGPGGRTSFFIRGTEARHVSFTLDDLKLNDPSNVDRQFDAAFLTLIGIDEILVHKGPQAVLYGSDAVGGHIELRTRKGSRNPEKKLSLTAGSFGTLGAAYRQDWSKGTVSVIRQRTDGISRFNKKRYDATERDGSEITQLLSSSRHEFFPNAKTEILASFIEGRNDLDVKEDSSEERSLNRQYLLQQKTKYKNFSLRNGLNRNHRVVKDLFSGKSNFDGNLYQNEILWEKKSLILGGASEIETFEGNGDRSFTLNSVFAQGRKSFGKLRTHGGLRADHHSRYEGFFAGAAGVELETLTGTWGTQYSRGYKAPSLFQLYDRSFGNSELDPESNQSFEASWKKRFGSLELENVAFVSRLSNLIVFTNNTYANQGRFVAEGVEPSIKWSGEETLLRGSFTHQRFRDADRKILRRPFNMAQLSASWFPTDPSELFVKGRWFDSRKDLDRNNAPVDLASFETFDLGGSYSFGKQTVSLQMVNVFGREFEEIYGFSVLPRSLFGSYSVTF